MPDRRDYSSQQAHFSETGHAERTRAAGATPNRHA